MPSVEPLLEGFRRFQAEYFGDSAGLFDTLKQGQKPGTLVIGCCDSRVHPATLTGSQPGELFIVRNVANLVPPHESSPTHASVAAALEFAVLSLGVQRIIVFGHACCGGIRALMDDSAPADSALARWLRIAAPAREHVRRDVAASAQERQRACEKAAILVSINNLLSYPWLRERVDDGRVLLDGWYFDMEQGALWGFDPHARGFTPLVCPLEKSR